MLHQPWLRPVRLVWHRAREVAARGTAAAVLMVWLAPAAVAAGEIPIADFARDESVEKLKISPDGTYLSEVRMVDGDQHLVVLRLSDKQVTASLDLGTTRRVDQYWWGSKDRIVMSFADQYNVLSAPVRTGELVSFDANDRGALKYLYGFRGASFTLNGRIDNQRATADYRAATVIKTLPEAGQDVIIAINDFTDEEGDSFPEVDRLDIHSGRRGAISHGPMKVYTEFLADEEGNPRYAIAYDKPLNPSLFAKSDPHAEWKQLKVTGGGDLLVRPEALSADGRRAYLLVSHDGGPDCLEEQDLATGVLSQLSCDPEVSVTDVIMSSDREEPIAAIYAGGPPWLRILDSTHPDRARLRALEVAFPGQIVVPVSTTEDGAKMLVLVYSDRNPGDYYLFDSKTLNATYLTSRHSWIDPDKMSAERPVSFKARDGQLLHGILTVPHGMQASKLPLVVIPHGGPFDILDTWGWHADTQLLASRGYATLQVNFRGSGGYGGNFLEAGRRHWDSVMIDDITDGTRWAIAQGITQAGRVCIYGASYGGYAALMSAVREPDLYRCAIGYDGVYDLVQLKKNSDLGDTASASTYFKEFIGDADERLKAASPITYIDKLKAAVMIAHGKDDERAPFSQAEELRQALDLRKLPCDWLAVAGEGHGFFHTKNRELLYQRMLAFLDRNIGSQSPAASAAAAPSAPGPAAASDAAPHGSVNRP